MKKVIFQERLRMIPKQFSWVDQRLVHEGHLREMTAEGTRLYLFLVTVADRNGVSWYSDRSIVERTGLVEVTKARRNLIDLGLVAYRRPHYQVLELPRVAGVQEQPQPRSCETLLFREILERLADEDKPQTTELNEYQLARKLEEMD